MSDYRIIYWTLPIMWWGGIAKLQKRKTVLWIFSYWVTVDEIVIHDEKRPFKDCVKWLVNKHELESFNP